MGNSVSVDGSIENQKVKKTKMERVRVALRNALNNNKSKDPKDLADRTNNNNDTVCCRNMS